MYLESGQLCPVRSGVLSVSHRDHHQRDIKHLDNSADPTDVYTIHHLGQGGVAQANLIESTKHPPKPFAICTSNLAHFSSITIQSRTIKFRYSEKTLFF